MRRRENQFPDNGFEAWGGYMHAKIAKLEEQFSSRAGNDEKLESNIFSGVSIFVNGYTNPPANELKTLMARHGGVYHTYQRSDDFIIATNLPDVKVKKLSLAKVVRPEWITESIASNKLLDFKDFLLYNQFRTQPKLNFDKIIKTDMKDELSESVSKIQRRMDDNKCTVSIPSTSEQSITAIKSDSTKTAADPNFISEFYNNSRLHHISQLGACFKQHINNLRDCSEFTFPARKLLKDAILKTRTTDYSQDNFDGGKTIMHIDMDCFFVSVGLRNRPELRGYPIAVTHSKGGQPRLKRPGVDRNSEFNLYKQKQAKKLSRVTGLSEDQILQETFETRVDNIAEDEDDKFGSMSEIASCSYEARAKGIKNGMFMGAALKLCPDIKTIPYDFEGYKEVAYTLYNTVAQYTLDIEAVSCDEMYVDCTELLKTLDITVQDFATALRQEIREKTGCPCSTGFGGNRLQARLATKHAKPNGQFFLFTELVHDFMFGIQLKDLPGVGRQTAQKLDTIGHHTCGSLQNVSLTALQQHLGNKTGVQLYEQCRGRDPNPLSFYTVRKSVSAEVNYGIRFENEHQCFEFLKQLSSEVHSRLEQFKVLGKCITLKIMVRAEDAPVETAKFMGHGFCDVINKSVNLHNATNDTDTIAKEVITIFKKQKIDAKELRGIGIQITKLEPLVAKQIKGAINKFLSVMKPNGASVVNTSPKKYDEDSAQTRLEVTKWLKDEKSPSTPKKVKFQSPIKKKSPVIGTFKSPSGRKRGRPPKNISLTRAQPSTSKILMSKFLQGNSTDNLTLKEEPVKQDVKVELNKTNNVPLTDETAKHKEQGLLGLSWQKVRELIRAWLDSQKTPLNYDIKLLTSYMREMVINKDIDKLNILLNFLRRKTKAMGCKEWIDVYAYITEQVQNTMIAVYGKELYILD